MEKEDHCTASFSSYSTGDQISETAERVRLEFSDESNDEFEFVTLRSDCDLVFPIFRQNLIAEKSTLFIEEEDQLNSSSSSSDEEESEGISSELYRRRWTPDKSRAMKSWRKSKSTGSSSSSWRRWVVKDLLKRSYSEGKESLKFQNSNSENTIKSTKKKKEIVSGHERKKVMKEEEKRKSYLPYKQHIFGFFGKTLLL